MFEKEAEEYAIENWEYYEEGKNDSKALKQAYLAGAEFGYNKAFVEADKNLKAIVADFNKEKCELLGIIQGKDKVIQELKKELNNMLVSKNQQLTKAKETIEKMKCCENCRHYSHTYGHCYSYDEYQNCKSLSNWRLAEC